MLVPIPLVVLGDGTKANRGSVRNSGGFRVGGLGVAQVPRCCSSAEAVAVEKTRCQGGYNVKFRLHTDYALRAMTYLAGKGTPASTDEIAIHFGISSAHLGRVIRKLQNMGFMKAVRGRKGGVRLAKDPTVLTLGEVVSALEDNGTLMDGLKPSETSGAYNLRLGAVLRRSSGLFIAYLTRTTFADLMNEPLTTEEVTSMDRPLVTATTGTTTTTTTATGTTGTGTTVGTTTGTTTNGTTVGTTVGTTKPTGPVYR